MSLKSNVAAAAVALTITVTPAIASSPLLGGETVAVGGFVHSGSSDGVSAPAIVLVAGTSASAAAESGRDAAIKRCNAEAQKHYRGIYYSWGDARNFAYKHCVFDAGVPE
jgi:hypothetical protein